MSSENQGPPPPPGPPPELKSAKKIKPISDELKGVSLKKVDEDQKNYKTLLDMFLKMDQMKSRVKSTKNFDVSKVVWKVWHGNMGDPNWEVPECVAKTDLVNRKDQGNETNASEFLDSEEVLDAKMKIVAALIKQSRMTVVYTGAGISRGAGIADYGTKAETSIMNKYKTVVNPASAQPTYSHFVLSHLEKMGLLHYYIQQNHDGLPQKAGFPQEKMNEIHGAWFDPSNPVVQFSGKLRSDLFHEMVELEEKAEFVLCMGTSLSGMNSDRSVWTPCEKYHSGMKNSLGSVLINLQFTPLDSNNFEGYVPIRVWAKIDDAMKLLIKHLGEEENFDIPKKLVKEYVSDKIECPYDKNGRISKTDRMILCLSPGEKVIICQPYACNFRKKGLVIGKDGNGNYIIEFGQMKRRLFGRWWMKCIQDGKINQLPLMNINPQFLEDGESLSKEEVEGEEVKKKERKKYFWTKNKK